VDLRRGTTIGFRRRSVAKKERGQEEHWSRLTSFVSTLYDEMDKLSKKAPGAEISDLALNRVNRAIESAKTLMDKEDEFIKDLAPFVPAGNNPQARDALLVLAEIRSGLVRFRRGMVT
jgi:hypothetical protein